MAERLARSYPPLSCVLILNGMWQVSVAHGAIDPARASWYGEEVFHRQLYDWLAEQANPLLRLANGNGYFF